MEFEIKRTFTVEFPQENLSADLNNLEKYISDRIAHKSYGNSVVKYFWGFELFRFNGGFAQFLKNNIESWKYSVKWLVTNSHFDWNIVKDLEEQETIKLIRDEMLSSVGRIGNMKKKPKDFDYFKFQEDLDFILTEYLESYSNSKAGNEPSRTKP
jgi:hypothetical protein